MTKHIEVIFCSVPQRKILLNRVFNEHYIVSNLLLDKEMMRCGASNVYIKPECVCSFHNVNEAKFHKYSFCPQGEEADDITQLRCKLMIM